MKLILSILISFNLSAQTKSKDNNNYLFAGAVCSGVGYSVYHLTNRPFLACFSGFITSSPAGIVDRLFVDKEPLRGCFKDATVKTVLWGSGVFTLILRVEIANEQDRNLKNYLWKYENICSIDTNDIINNRLPYY